MGLLIGLVIAAIFWWRRISIFRAWIHPSSHLRCHSGQAKPAPESGNEWRWFCSASCDGVCGTPAFAGATVERWSSPQKCPAVHLDVLPGDEARPGTAEEAHGRGDVGGFAAPAA